jgi:hypothetical protein
MNTIVWIITFGFYNDAKILIQDIHYTIVEFFKDTQPRLAYNLQEFTCEALRLKHPHPGKKTKAQLVLELFQKQKNLPWDINPKHNSLRQLQIVAAHTGITHITNLKKHELALRILLVREANT